ncbi:MAG: DNA polymerase IV [Candidatus Bipolaricaulota bacterium]|nr:DNA polymerase IV [Candidatus Bipolaricaulota bacterium]
MDAPSERWIGHLDMDAFFAAVEQLDEPKFRGKPVIVGGLGPRGVVATASYEARRFGVHSAMPMAVARKRCPDGAFVPPRFERYCEISARVREVLLRVSPVLETVSLDEAFFDVSEHGAAAMTVALAAKQEVQRETQLTCSVGVAPNRFLAKMGSDLSKPDGFLVIRPERVREILDPLPIGKMWGVGDVTERRLRGLGLLRIVDVRTAPVELLEREFGRMGVRLHELARGEDDTPIAGESESVSMSREVTYAVDLLRAEEIEDEVRRLARHVAGQLRAASMLCRTVRIKIRYPDFRTITRQVKLPVATDSEGLIETLAVHLLRQRAQLDERGVRLLGVGVSRLGVAVTRQLSLFDDVHTSGLGQGQQAPWMGKESMGRDRSPL